MTFGSFVRLGFYFAKRLLARVLTTRTGLARFRDNYWTSDHLLPLGAAAAENRAAFSACIACGLCDEVFDAYDRTDRDVFPGPSALPLSYSRNPPDFAALTRYLAELRKGDLVQLERVCPTRVPFRKLAAYVEAHARETEEARGDVVQRS